MEEEKVEEKPEEEQKAPVEQEKPAEEPVSEEKEETPQEEPAGKEEEPEKGDEAPGEEPEEEVPAEEPVSEEKEETPSEKKMVDLPKPVELGDELEVTIESVGAKGDGIAKKDGFVIFIPGAQKGETVKIKITELKTSFAIGETVQG